MDTTQSPLLSALPPETDYISYLTIVEQYLSEETLPILHQVLQDETLTSNIGWDLVQLLVPMLPASEECLQDIARLGNPREVILKVTEALRLLELDQIEAEVDPESKPKLTLQTPEQPVPLYVLQFDKLLSMLTLLHSRIKTKYPSRFLSTTLQAVLATFSNAVAHKEEMIVSIVQMVKKMRGILRPALPSRSSSASLSRTISSIANSNNAAAADPEATSGKTEPEEDAIQLKLFQSFLTHVLEDYMTGLTSEDGIPGLAWSSRIMETLHPERTVPTSKSMSKSFKDSPVLLARNDAVGQLISLAHDLKLKDDDLLLAAVTPDITVDVEEDEPPATANVIPLSGPGSILLLAARQASDVLHGRETKQGLDIFPQHNDLIRATFAEHGVLGTEPEALIDACIALGLLSLENDNIGAPANDEQFKEYLQTTSLLASNCPNSNLRGHAHFLVTSMLRSHPDDKVRYAFIRDTLEHCPFENLKTSAIGWLKGEFMEANLMTPTQEDSVFKSSITLDCLSPIIFPDLHAELITAPLAEAWTFYQTHLSFYLAVLNFVYLLITAQQLRERLDVGELWKTNDVAASFLTPLGQAECRFRTTLEKGDDKLSDNETERQHLLAELNLLASTIQRVAQAVPLLNES